MLTKVGGRKFKAGIMETRVYNQKTDGGKKKSTNYEKNSIPKGTTSIKSVWGVENHRPPEARKKKKKEG